MPAAAYPDQMEPWIAALVIPCTLLAGLVAGALTVRRLFLPTYDMKQKVEDLERTQDRMREVDIPSAKLAATEFLERAEGLLQSAETKRRRAAAAESRRRPEEDQGGDGQGEPWMDPSVSPQQRRAMLETLVNRRGG